MLAHHRQRGHGLAVNLRSTVVWCYECDEEVLSSDLYFSDFRTMIVGLVRGKSSPKRKPSGNPVPLAGKRSVKGVRGISNIGNTCFLAASLQCLSHTAPLQKLLRHCPPFSAHELVQTTPQQRLVVALRTFFLAQWGDPFAASSGVSETPVSPEDVLSAVQRLNALFQGYQQHDAHELLRFLLSSVHEASATPKGGSIVSDVFMGKTCSTITCLHCGKDSKCVEDFFDLSLPIPAPPDDRPPSLWGWTKGLFGLTAEPKVALTDCIRQFLNSEKLSGQNAYRCDHCKGTRECTKQLALEELPEVLLLHLKRFGTTSWGGSSKLSRQVAFPVATDLDLNTFVGNKSGKAVKYRLAGFVQHMGSMTGGHYIAYCRHKTTGQWHCFDDSRVSLVTDLAAVEAAEPYVLFYQRVAEPTVIAERALVKKAKLGGLGGVNGTSPAGRWVGREWLCRVQSMSHIPTTSTHSLVCTHGRPSTTCPIYAKSQFVKVSSDYAKRVPVKCPDSLELCEACLRFVSAYNRRLAGEHKLVSKLDTKGIAEDQVWFFIDSAWVTKWRQYLRQGAVADANKAAGPGPIDNSALAARIGKKAKLQISTDFIAVNPSVWTVFTHCHGLVGPVITRTSLDLAGGAAALESVPPPSLTDWGLTEDEWTQLGAQFVIS